MRRGILVVAPVLAMVLLAGDSPSPEGPSKVSIPGVENAFRLAPTLFSGGQPEGEAAFEALAKLGVKTIVSVDGAPPDVKPAHDLGIKYVHVPVGYDGIDSKSAAKLVKVMRALPGPVFVHCHHGKHRGPAAAGLCAMAAEDWTKAEARAWLQQAGTSEDYPGLYKSVDRFEIPGQEVLSTIDPARDLPEQADPPALVQVMVELDAAWDQLKGLAAHVDRAEPPPPQTRRAMAALALLLAEHYREAARLPEAKRNSPDFVKALKDAEQKALKLQRQLRSAAAMDQVQAAARLAAQSCLSCHQRHRDQER